MSSEILVGKPVALAAAFARRCEAEAESALAARARFALLQPNILRCIGNTSMLALRQVVPAKYGDRSLDSGGTQ